MNIVNLLVSRWNARSCNKIRSIFLLPIPSFLSRRWTVYFRSSQLLPRFLHSCALLRFSSFSNYFTSFNHNNNTQFHPPDSVDGSFVVRGKCRSPETTYFTHTWFVVIQIYLLPLLSLLTYFNFMNEIEPKWNFHVDSDPFALDFMLNFVPLGHWSLCIVKEIYRLNLAQVFILRHRNSSLLPLIRAVKLLKWSKISELIPATRFITLSMSSQSFEYLKKILAWVISSTFSRLKSWNNFRLRVIYFRFFQ